MPTYNVGIGKDDIQEAVLLPEDWYQAELVKDYEDKNSAWKDAGKNLGLAEAKNINEKAGKNIILNLTVISDVPEFEGRRITKWLPLPSEFDEGQYNNRGQHVPDAKAEAIHKWASVFGESDGGEVSFKTGAKGLIYIILDTDQNDEEVNAISMNVDPRPLGSDDGLDGGSGEGVLLDDEPTLS